jgi:hypothetical protein
MKIKYVIGFGIFILLGIVLMSLPTSVCAGGACTTIQSGELYTSDGNLITPGYDEFGYNYQAHMFSGRYCDYDRVIGGAYCDVDLIMKWNDTWLSNKDCDGDGKLDRYYGFDSYIGSGAWQTNFMAGEYDLDGKICKWTAFTKFVAVPVDAYEEGGVWYNVDGIEIGTSIWNAFAIVEDVYNDPCGGFHGVSYLSPDHPGFGGW